MNSLLSALRILPKQGSVMRMVSEVLTISTGLWIAMPFNCAFYTQFNKISIDQLEPEIQERARAKGLQYLIFNKGL